MNEQKLILTSKDWEIQRKSADNAPGEFHGQIAKQTIFWFNPKLSAWIKQSSKDGSWYAYDSKTGKKHEKINLPENYEPWAKAFDDSEAPFYQWFKGGLTNACFNEVDAHVLAGRGDEIALIFEGDPWDKQKNAPQFVKKVSRKMLLWEVTKYALILQNLGLKMGDRIVLNMPNILEQIYFIEAAKRLGIIYTSVFSGFSAKTLAQRIQDTGAVLGITTDGVYNNGQVVSFKNEFMDKALDEHIPNSKKVISNFKVLVVNYVEPPNLKWNSNRDLSIKELEKKAIEQFWKFGNSIGLSVKNENEIISLPDEKFIELIYALVPPLAVDAEFPLFIIYTSGSTGKPKGLVHTHGGYVAGIAHTMRIAFNVDPDAPESQTIYVIADPGWITGQSYMISAALTTRTTSVISDASPLYPNAGRFAGIIGRYKVNIFKAGSTFLKTVASNPENINEVKKYDLSSLKVATFCAEPTSPAIQKFAMELITPRYINSYWGTEHGGIILTHFYGNQDFELKPNAHTFPLPWIFSDVWIPEKSLEIDGKNLYEYRVAEEGEKGEIVITKPYPYLARTLWGDAENVKKPGWRGDVKTFHETYFKKWLKEGKPLLVYTQGDYASKYSDGSMSLHGRSDDVINTSGHRLSTEEIEHAILRDKEIHPDSRVKNVIVAAGPHPERGTVPYAFVLTEKGQALSEEEEARLINLVRLEKGALAIPGAFIYVSQFPETRSGKYMRRFLHNILQGEIIGDKSALKNPESLEEIEQAIQKHREKESVEAEQAILKNSLNEAKPSDRKEIAYRFIEKLLKEALGLAPDFSIHKDKGFFDLGMDSILTQVFTEKLQRSLGDFCTLNATVLFDYPSINALAEFISEKSNVEEKSELVFSSENLHEPIAVIGMSCRFPGGGVDPEAFWKTLREGVDGIVDIPADRWNINDYYDPNPDALGKMTTKKGGFIEHIDLFDAEFFGINPRETELIDPQQRLLLEVSYEALERSGIAPESVRNSLTGVFVGVSYCDYGTLILQEKEKNLLNLHFGTGTALNAISGRISYFFGFNGPSMAVDTACSSSLVSLHLACKSLQNNECHLALAGGVNILLQPDIFIAFSRGHMLAPDGHCKTFDAGANGYGRGEGIGVVVLKRLSDAEKDGDSILAIIPGSAVNQDGVSSGLTVPSAPAQEKLMRRALLDARLKPEDISYIEAHGTGTELGDPIEISAIEKVYGSRKKTDPLMLGAVKSNIGHLESAAGIASVIKVILALNHQEIPPNLNFKSLNPKINLNTIPGKVVTEPSEWKISEGHKRRAGVSGFGFSGTIAHVILEEAPPRKVANNVDPRDKHLITFSAKTEWALNKILENYADFLEFSSEDIADIVYSANTGRNHYEYRAAVLATDRNNLREKLKTHEFRKTKSLENAGSIHFEYANSTDLFVEEISPREVHIKLGINSDWNRLYDKLMDYYLQGFEITWNELEAPFPKNKIILPTYPFNRVRHWAKFSEKTHLPGLIDENLNPMLGRQIVTQAKDRIIFESHVSATWPFFFPYHKVFDYVVIAGHCYMSGALSALERINNGVGYVEQVEWLQPVVLPENMKRCLQTIFTPSGEKHMDFKVISCDESLLYTEPEWVEHAVGRICLEKSKVEFDSINIEEVIQRCPQRIGQIEVYGKLFSLGLHLYEPHFVWIEELYYGEGEMLAKMRLPLEKEKKNFVLFPGCIDACAQGHIAREVIFEGSKLLRIPLAIGEYSYDKSKGYVEWVYYKKKQGEQKDEIAYLLNGKGEFLGAQVNFRTREVTPEALKKAIVTHKAVDQWFYGQAWKALPLSSVFSAQAEKKWIVFDNQERKFLVDDKTNIRIIQGKEFKKVNDIFYEIDPENQNDYIRLVEAIGKETIGIIHLWSPEGSENFSTEKFRDAQNEVSKSALYLALALLKNPELTHLPVSFVSFSAQSFQNGKINLYSVPMLGFMKTLVLEQAQLKWKLIDVDQIDSIDFIKAECLNEPGEHFLCYRHGLRYAARLEQRKIPKPSESIEFKKEGTYIVTGGLGGLGLTLANWLSLHGAGKIVLLARSMPSKEVSKKLESMNERVSFQQLDISKKEDVKNLFQTYQKSDKPIKGIFHLAGVLSDAPLDTQTWEKFEKVYSPKVDGGWNLHEQALEDKLDLDYFVLYSSTASMIGSVGQLNYSAANAFLDGLSAYREAMGLQSKTIHWGPWKEVGMAAALVDHHKKYGINPTAPIDNMDALERVLLSDLNDVMISSIDWKKYLEYHRVGEDSWLSNFSVSKVKFEKISFIDSLNALPTEEREHFIKNEVENVVKSVLGFEIEKKLEENKDFYDLGMDSLLSVELRNKLQEKLGDSFKLSMTAVYDYVTLAQLSAHIVEGFGIKSSETAHERKSPKGKLIILNPEQGLGKIRLFCFPSGGSGASLFQGWRELFPDTIDLAFIQLPGREQRIAEPAIVDRDVLMKELLESIDPYLNKPFAFFGHSLGGLIAVNLADELLKQQKAMPSKIFISAVAPEEIFLTKFNFKEMLSKSDEGFIEDVQKYFKGIPEFILDRPDLLKLFLPILRNDFALASSLKIQDRHLDIPLLTFLGNTDPAFTEEELSRWKKQTSSSFDSLVTQGSHFALLDNPKQYIDFIIKNLLT